jgi:hypothetical protein
MSTQVELKPSDLSRLSTMARTLIKNAEVGTSPWVGIPVPSRHPFVVSRKMLASVTSGLRVTSVRVAKREDNRPAYHREQGLVLALTIEGVRGQRSKARYVIFDRKCDWQARGEIATANKRWADSTRLRIRAKKTGSTPKAQRLILRYTKEIAKLQHRLVADHNYKALGTRLRFKPQPSPFVHGPRTEDRRWRNDSGYASWYAQKAARKTIANIVALYIDACNKGQRVNWTKLYAALAAAGFSVTYTYGRQAGWVRGKTERDYLRSMHEQCGKMAVHPWYTERYGDESGTDAERGKRHMDELRHYVAIIHEKQQIEFEIAALRQMIADISSPTQALPSPEAEMEVAA